MGLWHHNKGNIRAAKIKAPKWPSREEREQLLAGEGPKVVLLETDNEIKPKLAQIRRHYQQYNLPGKDLPDGEFENHILSFTYPKTHKVDGNCLAVVPGGNVQSVYLRTQEWQYGPEHHGYFNPLSADSASSLVYQLNYLRFQCRQGYADEGKPELLSGTNPQSPFRQEEAAHFGAALMSLRDAYKAQQADEKTRPLLAASIWALENSKIKSERSSGKFLQLALDLPREQISTMTEKEIEEIVDLLANPVLTESERKDRLCEQLGRIPGGNIEGDFISRAFTSEEDYIQLLEDGSGRLRLSDAVGKLRPLK